MKIEKKKKNFSPSVNQGKTSGRPHPFKSGHPSPVERKKGKNCKSGLKKEKDLIYYRFSKCFAGVVQW